MSVAIPEVIAVVANSAPLSIPVMPRNGRVYSQDIGHCEKGGDACDDFGSDRRRCRIKSEVFLEKLIHFNKQSLKSRKIKENLRIKTVLKSF